MAADRNLDECVFLLSINSIKIATPQRFSCISYESYWDRLRQHTECICRPPIKFSSNLLLIVPRNNLYILVGKVIPSPFAMQCAAVKTVLCPISVPPQTYLKRPSSGSSLKIVAIHGQVSGLVELPFLISPFLGTGDFPQSKAITIIYSSYRRVYHKNKHLISCSNQVHNESP